jgi:hypothetical protein
MPAAYAVTAAMAANTITGDLDMMSSLLTTSSFVYLFIDEASGTESLHDSNLRYSMRT